MSDSKEEIRQAYQREEDTSKAVFIPAKERTSIYSENSPFVACAYCRVSTDNEEQTSSFELQQKHYRNLAEGHSNWDLRKIFADEGISGTSMKNRDQFNEMIEACKRGEYNLIVTKSVSRFARNIVDCVSLVRQLKNLPNPVGVFFETDGLFTLSEDSELKLSILATFAQEESVKKSESMTWSIKERNKNGKLLTPELLGYRRPRDSAGHYIKYGKLEIEPAEAEVVKFIFNAFLAGYTADSIASILTDIGIRTKLGNTSWNTGAIHYILRNERYCGDILTWKTFTADIFEHKKKKNHQDRDQYLYRDDHPAIISVEQFDAAQRLLDDRRHGLRGGYNLLRVIDSGVFQGYVPINHHWANNDPDVYYKASDSVRVEPRAPQRIRRDFFSAFNLTGYQVVRGQFLTARTEQPCINISSERISFNSACSRKFFDVPFIQLLLHPTERKVAIRPCKERDSFAINWRVNSTDPFISKIISSPHFCRALYQIMDWNPEYNYRIIGTFIERGLDQIVIFNLSNAMPIALIETESRYRRRQPICPEEWEDNFGNEFYDFSMENRLYYGSKHEHLNASQQSRVVEGQIEFDLFTNEQVMESAEKLKEQVGIYNA